MAEYSCINETICTVLQAKAAVFLVDISAVAEGQLISPSARRLNFGLQSVSQQLGKLLLAKGCTAQAPDTLDILRNAILRVAESAAEAGHILGQVGLAFPLSLFPRGSFPLSTFPTPPI